MFIEEALVQLLREDADVSAIVGARIYPQIAPQNSPFPRIVYQRVTTTHIEHMQGSSGLARALIQVDSYSPNYDEAKALSEAIRLLLQPVRSATVVIGDGTDAKNYFIGGIHLTNTQDLYEVPTDAGEIGLHRVRQDWGIWSDESTGGE